MLNLAPDNADRQKKIGGYISKFGINFATILYDSYIQKNNYETLMTSDPHTLEIFLNSRPELAWIYNINIKNYAKASDMLCSIATESNTVEHQILLQSISYLCAVESKVPDSSIVFENSLRFLQLQLQLQTEFKTIGIDNALQNHFKNCDEKHDIKATLQRLIAGQPCRFEEIVDILSLFGTFQYLETAYDIFQKYEHLPEDYNLFWQRLYEFTNWKSFPESDAWKLINLIISSSNDDSMIYPGNVVGSGIGYDAFKKKRVEIGMDKIVVEMIHSNHSIAI
jgi:hypothetical protein